MTNHLENAFYSGEFGKYDTPTRKKLVEDMDLIDQKWFKSVPAHTIYGAMRTAEKDYKMMVRKRKQGLEASVPRCRKRTQRSFFVLGNAITPKGIYSRLLGLMRSAEPLPLKPADGQIIFAAGKFWLRTSYEVTNEKADSQGRVCSIDPGVRTFATIFSTQGVGKVASKSFSLITRLALNLDNLISRTALTKNKQTKQRMFVAQARARLRIKNLIETLHWQTAGWLFENFDTVIFPQGNFTSATYKASRKISAKSVRSLLSYSFAKFRDRLQFKAETTGKRLVTVCESYTSKTHNITGEIKQKLGGSKFTSSRGIRIDRDINGALGTYLKALLAQPDTSSALLTGVNIK